MKNYRKTYLILTAMMSITAFSIVARNKQDSLYKNLQVFPKNISEARMNKEMELFSKSLGVDCQYCHVKNENNWDFASDKIGHKKDARAMMIMTNGINSKYFGVDSNSTEPYTVMNCYTCHRGEEFPIIAWDTSGVKSPAKSTSLQTSPWNNYRTN
jgi:hypothetical protein